MHSHHRSNNLYKNTAYHTFSDKPIQTTTLQPKAQPLLHRDNERWNEREKLTKENTQLNTFDKFKEPLKKTQPTNKGFMHIKPVFGKTDHCTKVIPAKLPMSTTIRTESR